MLLTLKEVCKLVKVSPETVRKWRKLDKFPAPKTIIPNGKLLWLISDIEKWIKRK